MKLVGWEQLATQGVPRWQVHKGVAGNRSMISCSVCRFIGGGYLVVKVRCKLNRCEADKLEFTSALIK